jgi:hypothetical protein
VSPGVAGFDGPVIPGQRMGESQRAYPADSTTPLMSGSTGSRRKADSGENHTGPLKHKAGQYPIPRRPR